MKTPIAPGVHRAAERMKAWAAANPHANTQGIEDDEWLGLADAAIRPLGQAIVKTADALLDAIESERLND